jgi:hypothetical protein
VHRRLWFLLFSAFLISLSFHAFGFGAQPGITVQLQHVIKAAPAASNHTSTNSADTYVLGYASDVGTAYQGSVQCDWASLTGTVNATLQVNWSDDGGAHWIAKGSPITFSGASGTGGITFTIDEQYYQFVYTAGTVSGGTVDCYLLGK